MNWVLVFLLGAAAVVLALAWWMIASSVTKIKGLYEQIRELQDTNQKISSQKKSSEVRVGQIAENMAPFLKDFKYDPNGWKKSLRAQISTRLNSPVAANVATPIIILD